MSTIGEQMAKDERQKDRQSRIAQREAIERRLRRESWAIAGAIVGGVVVVGAAALGLLWVAIKVVRLAWGS
jgi:hypothetical protein